MRKRDSGVIFSLVILVLAWSIFVTLLPTLIVALSFYLGYKLLFSLLGGRKYLPSGCDPGYVYVLSNPSMPDVLKIGKTTRTPEERAIELSRATGIPTPFKIECSIAVGDCSELESYLHDKLRGYRRNESREFFSVSVDKVKKLIASVEGKSATRSFSAIIPMIKASYVLISIFLIYGVFSETVIEPKDAYQQISLTQPEIDKMMSHKDTEVMLVKRIQAGLNKHGFNLGVDGVPGEKTFKAIINYNKAHFGMSEGIISPDLLTELEVDIESLKREIPTWFEKSINVDQYITASSILAYGLNKHDLFISMYCDSGEKISNIQKTYTKNGNAVNFSCASSHSSRDSNSTRDHYLKYGRITSQGEIQGCGYVDTVFYKGVKRVNSDTTGECAGFRLP